MAIQAIATIPVSGNIAVRPRVRISTATLPGLIQSYCDAAEVIPHFHPEPGLLRLALDDQAGHEQAIFLLQQGAKAMNALECLEDGGIEALDYARTLITGMVRDLYRHAEKAQGVMA